MKIKHQLIMLALPLLSMLAFVACSDNLTPEVVTPKHFIYNKSIFNEANSMTYRLDSLGAPIVSIAGAPRLDGGFLLPGQRRDAAVDRHLSGSR